MLRLTAVLAAALLAPAAASAQYAGSNVTGRAGLIAIDKLANRVRFYDPVTMAEVRVLVPPGKSVHELTVAYDHQTAYAPLYGDGIYGANPEPNNKILVIDLPHQAITRTIDLGEHRAPHGMAATHDGKLWVVCDLENQLLLVDPPTGTVEATYDTGAKGPHFLALLPDESKLYVSHKEGPVRVFDVGRRQFVATVPLGRPGATDGAGGGGEGLAPSPDGRRLVVADNDRSDLRVIDTRTDREIERVPLTGAPLTNPKRSRLTKLMFSPDGRWLVAAGYAGGQVWVIDASDFHRQSVVPVAKGPMGIAFTPDGVAALVSSHDSGLITRIDLARKKAVAATDGGGGIEVLAFY